MFSSHTLLVNALAALIPLLVGFLWYNPKTFGNAWIKAAKVNPEEAKNANMVLVFGLTYLFSFFITGALISMVIHQVSLFSLVADQLPDSSDHQLINSVYEKFKGSFRTFKHGALHGSLAGIMLALPIIGINALFEGKGGKYILINVGYWVVTLALMGGVICQFA